ncbi:ribosomal protein L16 [bacterium]|nr:ribosomal protein L16 [bacterium]
MFEQNYLIYSHSGVNKYMAESYLDRPQDDETRKAHPAYNRGKLASTVYFLKLIKGTVSGTDIGEGQISSPQIEAARRAILHLSSALKHASGKSTYLSSQAKEAIEKAQEELDKINI